MQWIDSSGRPLSKSGASPKYDPGKVYDPIRSISILTRNFPHRATVFLDETLSLSQTGNQIGQVGGL